MVRTPNPRLLATRTARMNGSNTPMSPYYSVRIQDTGQEEQPQPDLRCVPGEERDDGRIRDR